MTHQPQDAALTPAARIAAAAAVIATPKPRRAPIGVRVANLIAIVLLWGSGVGWIPLALFGVMYVLTGLGITIGYHRLFTHKSFDTGPVMKFIIGVLGSMAVEGPILQWVATHRQHHQHSDDDDDPHSPHAHGAGFWNMLRGLVHAHMGWIIRPRHVDFDRYVPDLKKDRIVRVVSRTFPLWVLLGLLIPTIVAGVATMSWWGAFLGFLWGGLARVFFVHHVTWSINSVCHLWGAQPFDCHDESRNNPIFGVLGFGEGWHNNHHAFPASARHGLFWWQFDISYILIRAMESVGLARDVRTPKPEHIIRKLRAQNS